MAEWRRMANVLFSSQCNRILERSGYCAAPGFGAAPAGWGGLRTMITSVMSGATTPPMIRSIELTLTVSLLTAV